MKVPLFQVVVETKDGEHLRIGPKMAEEAVGNLAMAINAQIALGKERAWGSAHVVPASL